MRAAWHGSKAPWPRLREAHRSGQGVQLPRVAAAPAPTLRRCGRCVTMCGEVQVRGRGARRRRGRSWGEQQPAPGAGSRGPGPNTLFRSTLSRRWTCWACCAQAPATRALALTPNALNPDPHASRRWMCWACCTARGTRTRACSSRTRWTTRSASSAGRWVQGGQRCLLLFINGWLGAGEGGSGPFAAH